MDCYQDQKRTNNFLLLAAINFRKIQGLPCHHYFSWKSINVLEDWQTWLFSNWSLDFQTYSNRLSSLVFLARFQRKSFLFWSFSSPHSHRLDTDNRNMGLPSSIWIYWEIILSVYFSESRYSRCFTKLNPLLSCHQGFWQAQQKS